MQDSTIALLTFTSLVFLAVAWRQDGRDVQRFAELPTRYTRESERALAYRMTARVVAVLCLSLSIDKGITLLAERYILLELGRFASDMTAVAYMLRLHYHYQLVKETARRAFALKVLKAARRNK